MDCGPPGVPVEQPRWIAAGRSVDPDPWNAGRAAGAPVAGFYTYGEFPRTRGVTGFHNQTLVVLAVG